MRFQPSHKWKWALASAGLVFAAILGSIFWRASRALRDSTEQIMGEDNLRFSSARLSGASTSNVDWISPPAVWSDAIIHRSHLYLAGPAGLFEFDSAGKMLARYRVGLELPSYPPASLATGVLADSEGQELFVATAGGGLLIFSGSDFQQILPEESELGELTSVLPLSTGRILLGTSKRGVLVFDGKRLSRFHAGVSDLPVTALAGSESSLWIGTLDRGVLHWHAGQTDHFAEQENLPDRQVLSIATQGERTYVGTPMGVAEFLGGRFNRVLASGFFTQSLLVRKEKLYVGTFDEGIIEVSLRTGRTPSPWPRTFEIPGCARRLLGTDDGLAALTDEGFYSLTEHGGAWSRVVTTDQAQLADRNISALAFDPAGRLWVGYFDRGLDILEPGGAQATHIENEHVFCVNRIVYDPQRNGMAVGTANGLVLFDTAGRQRQVLGRPEGMIADHVTDIAIGEEGMALATPAGLTLLTATGLRSLYAFHGLVNNHVYALASSGNQLLVGTLGGLSIVTGSEVKTSYTTANSGLKHNWVTAIVPVDDDWFIGTYGGGILRLDTTGHWQGFADLAGSFSVNPNAMLATEKHVFAGTLGKGLLVYDREAARWTTMTAGLPSRNVTALAPHSGYVYVGTDNGLVRIPE